jgi:hypothetical protein
MSTCIVQDAKFDEKSVCFALFLAVIAPKFTGAYLFKSGVAVAQGFLHESWGHVTY